VYSALMYPVEMLTRAAPSVQLCTCTCRAKPQPRPLHMRLPRKAAAVSFVPKSMVARSRDWHAVRLR